MRMSRQASGGSTPAVRCGRIITGRSAGHAVSFGLEILRGLKGAQVADQVRHAMYLDR